ncbi:MAG: biopolymer transporter ExbB [Deltaproteobacteria bacterium]|nr:MAG: biopolymer transporter ExbB [Deltaproteobacteria bacterium]
MKIFIYVIDFLDKGGITLYAIFLMAIFMWILIIERYLYIYLFSWRTEQRLISEWDACCGFRDAANIREYFQYELKHALVAWIDVIKVLVTLSPLLGLFGTVYGMIEMFDVIAENGTGDARAMASGISVATLSTMSGMAVAITGLFFQHQIESLANRKALKFNDKLKIKEFSCQLLDERKTPKRLKS